MASIEELRAAITEGRRAIARLVLQAERDAPTTYAMGSPELAAWLAACRKA